MKNHTLNFLFSITLFFGSFLSTNTALAQDTLLLKGLVEIDAINANKEKVNLRKLIEAAQREGLPKAEKHFRKARTFNVIGAVLGYPGSILTGWELGGFLAVGRFKNPELLYVGLGLWSANIILAATVRDPQLRKGVRIYNEAMHQKRINATSQ